MLEGFLFGTFGVEIAGYAWRYTRRGIQYRKALARARELGRPLYIFGAPDRGPTGTVIPVPYGCGQSQHGDRVVDIGPSKCRNAIKWDLRKGLPWLGDASIVVFESCVIEYVQGDPYAIARELQRVSGGEMFCVRVEPWCPITHIATGSHHLVRSAATDHTGDLAPEGLAPEAPQTVEDTLLSIEPLQGFG
jgi:hypothetical protein